MSEIYSVYEVFPDGDAVDVATIEGAIAKAVPAGVEVKKTEIREHVFGLKKVYAEFLLNADDEMIGSKLEDALSGIEGVGSIECVSSTNV